MAFQLGKAQDIHISHPTFLRGVYFISPLFLLTVVTWKPAGPMDGLCRWCVEKSMPPQAPCPMQSSMLAQNQVQRDFQLVGFLGFWLLSFFPLKRLNVPGREFYSLSPSQL